MTEINAYIVHFKGEPYVFYLATEKSIRGGGYGSRILEWIKENNRGMSIILDMEAPVEGSTNASERIKRIEFYHKNGILDTGYTIMDIRYMVLSASLSSFNPDNMVKCWRRYVFGLFNERPRKECS